MHLVQILLLQRGCCEDEGPKNQSCSRLTWHLEPSAREAVAPERAPCSETQDASWVAVDSDPPLPILLGDAQHGLVRDSALLQRFGEVGETSPGHLHCFNAAVPVGGLVLTFGHGHDGL